MYGNSYLGQSQYNNQYYPYQQNYQNYTNMQMQQRPAPMQPQQTMQPQEMPFSDVRYGTLDEAKAHIVMPGKAVMFINRNLGEFYVKSANNMGEPLLESFKYSSINAVDTSPVVIDTKNFVKPEDIKDFVNRDDISGFIRKDDLKGFITIDDLKVLENKIEQLKKQIDITQMLKGENNNGK